MYVVDTYITTETKAGITYHYIDKTNYMLNHYGPQFRQYSASMTSFENLMNGLPSPNLLLQSIGATGLQYQRGNQIRVLRTDKCQNLMMDRQQFTKLIGIQTATINDMVVATIPGGTVTTSGNTRITRTSVVATPTTNVTTTTNVVRTDLLAIGVSTIETTIITETTNGNVVTTNKTVDNSTGTCDIENNLIGITSSQLSKYRELETSPAWQNVASTELSIDPSRTKLPMKCRQLAARYAAASIGDKRTIRQSIIVNNDMIGAIMFATVVYGGFDETESSSTATNAQLISDARQSLETIDSGYFVGWGSIGTIDATVHQTNIPPGDKLDVSIYWSIAAHIIGGLEKFDDVAYLNSGAPIVINPANYQSSLIAIGGNLGVSNRDDIVDLTLLPVETDPSGILGEMLLPLNDALVLIIDDVLINLSAVASSLNAIHIPIISLPVMEPIDSIDYGSVPVPPNFAKYMVAEMYALLNGALTDMNRELDNLPATVVNAFISNLADVIQIGLVTYYRIIYEGISIWEQTVAKFIEGAIVKSIGAAASYTRTLNIAALPIFEKPTGLDTIPGSLATQTANMQRARAKL